MIQYDGDKKPRWERNRTGRYKIAMRTLNFILIGYLLIINIVGYTVMGIDKSRAQKGAWRISEATLFTVALIGGSVGCIAGMQHFRHKTKHWYFKYGMPAILIVQFLGFILLSYLYS